MLLLCLSYKFGLSGNKDRIGLIVQKVTDSERSECGSFAQERCKRLATVNEVNPLFLRKVKQASLAVAEGVCFRVIREATVKAALFTLRYRAKLATANAVRTLLLRKVNIVRKVNDTA
jgi:hypothetical protein